MKVFPYICYITNYWSLRKVVNFVSLDFTSQKLNHVFHRVSHKVSNFVIIYNLISILKRL